MENIYLLGDSITERNTISHSDLINYGKSGWTTENLINDFPQIEKNSLVLLMIGINDLLRGTNIEEILVNFGVLKNKLNGTNLRVFSVLPSKEENLNDKISKLNMGLKSLFEDYIDIYDGFLKNNKLADEISIDNIHLNGEGYIILNKYVAKEIYINRKPQGVKARFLEYTKWFTTSDDKSESYPSTIGQWFFGSYLEAELKDIGLSKVNVDKFGYITATLPKNTDKKIPKVAFIAHMDTAPNYNGKNCNAQIIKSYDGKDIVLDEKENTIMSPVIFPSLKNYIGEELITTDGTSLLGADDKAGIAEIVTAFEYFINNPDILHGKLKVAFTPDEEIGSGTKYFDVEKFGADYAYTMDGGTFGELEFENFNAASLELKVTGRSVHPGSAKNSMIHAGQLLMEFNSMLPVNERPEFTEEYEGFFMMESIKAGIEDGEISYIIRDHSKEKFESKKILVKNIVDLLECKYPTAKFDFKIEDSYYNMREKIEPVYFLIDIAKEVMEGLNIEPIISPVRGGTDGARLSYMGLPCPNIFTGGHNFHGKFEYIPTKSMELAVEVIINIAKGFVIRDWD